MCGINILYHKDRSKPEKESLRRMNAALRHRGPDGEGMFLSDGVGLGHTRLSIVDAPAGKQPMTSADNNLTISYNGELYNFKELRELLKDKGVVFSTQSDTEVVLYLYKIFQHDCVKHMRGMFSFAIYDKERKKLFIARDRLGIKPLFYSWDGHYFVAASEIKAIFASGYIEPHLCKASIVNYLTYQFSISPYTPFESVYELPAGHSLTIDVNAGLKINKYWQLEYPRRGEYESMDEKYWLSGFSDAMYDAVRSHTIGDFPIGSYLSGGIDSCTITKILLDTYSSNVETFSIGFADKNHDESSEYKQVSDHLGVPNTQLFFTQDESVDYLSLFKKCLYHLEQPQRMSVDIPHYMLSRLVRDNDYKVICSGDGADEILAGYDCFRQDSMRLRSNGLLKQFFRKKQYLNNYTQYFSEDHMRLLLGLHARNKQRETISKFGFYPAWYDFWQINSHHRDSLFLDDLTADVNQQDQLNDILQDIGPELENRDSLNQSLILEMKTRLPGWILWKSDRLSMANSVEVRVPFMDHSLVEFSARIPPSLKLNGMNEKYILKLMMSKHLPDLPHGYKKRGFYAPIRKWFFTKNNEETISSLLSVQSLEESGIFNPTYVKNIYSNILKMSEPNNMNEYYNCMKLEWLLSTVLSVQILHRLFVKKEAACFSFDELSEQRMAGVVS